MYKVKRQFRNESRNETMSETPKNNYNSNNNSMCTHADNNIIYADDSHDYSYNNYNYMSGACTTLCFGRNANIYVTLRQS